MGWLSWGYEPRDTDTVMRQDVCNWSKHDAATGDTHTVLASALVGTTWYSAIEHILASSERRVFAVICLTSRRDGFAYKDMDESMGPCESACPKRVLELLTPTDSEYANAWRERCRNNAATKRAQRKAMPKAGDRVVFNEPLSFGGVMLADFVIIPTPARHRGLIARRADGQGGLYRLPAGRLAEATITPA